MADFLLIHGSCHGAWCWREVVPLLEQNGHTARAIDLPSHGADMTPVSDVTLVHYAKAIADACGPQTVLVGHSMGGYAITAAAHLAKAKIAQLIYLCAYVPQDGLTLTEMRKLAPRQPLLPAVQTHKNRLSFTLDLEMARDLFYHDCALDTARDALQRLCPQAIAPTEMPVPEIDLPRHYIRCLDDQTIPPEFQIKMTKDWPAEDVQEMPCGHSPFFADPAGLVRCLNEAVRE